MLDGTISYFAIGGGGLFLREAEGEDGLIKIGKSKVVFFVREGGGEVIKVKETIRSRLTDRTKTLQTGNGRQLHLLGYIPAGAVVVGGRRTGGRALARRLHPILPDSLGHDWFKPSLTLDGTIRDFAIDQPKRRIGRPAAK